VAGVDDAGGAGVAGGVGVTGVTGVVGDPGVTGVTGVVGFEGVTGVTGTAGTLVPTLLVDAGVLGDDVAGAVTLESAPVDGTVVAVFESPAPDVTGGMPITAASLAELAAEAGDAELVVVVVFVGSDPPPPQAASEKIEAPTKREVKSLECCIVTLFVMVSPSFVATLFYKHGN
jgi:hypothetical protein